MKKNTIIKIVLSVGYVIFQHNFAQAAAYDPTFIGFGSAISYTGAFKNGFLDSSATTVVAHISPSDNAIANGSSPYGIVTCGHQALRGVSLPNYPLTQFPSLSRFNKSGSPDTTFGLNQPGSGYFIADPTGSTFTTNENSIILAAQGFYYLVDVGTSGQITLTRFLPTSERMDQTLDQTFFTYQTNGSTHIAGALVTGACIDQVTSKIYITYNDGTDSYVAAFTPSTSTYPLAPFSFVPDTAFNSTGVAKFAATQAAGATSVIFTGIAFDDYTNKIALVGNVIGVTAQLIIARFTVGGQAGDFITIIPGSGINPTFTPSTITSILPKYAAVVENSDTPPLYYLLGFDGTSNIQILYFDPSLQSLVQYPGGSGYLKLISTVNGSNTYTPTDIIQMPDISATFSVAVAVGIDLSDNTSCILNFQLENLAKDIGGNTYPGSPTVEKISATTFEAGDSKVLLYSCAYDSTLNVVGTNPAGLVVAGDHGPRGVIQGVFANYAYVNLATQFGLVAATPYGVGLFDYQNTAYPSGFTFINGFYSNAITGGATPSYFLLVSGNRAAADYDMGVLRFDLATNAFDMNYSGTSGDPFFVIASHVQPAQTVLIGTVMYSVGVATSVNANPSYLVLAACDLTGTAGAFYTTFSRTGFADNGVIYFSPALQSGTAYSNVDMVAQTVNNVKYLVVAGNNGISPFVARYYSTPTPNTLDGIRDDSFGTSLQSGSAKTKGYSSFTGVANSSFTACVLDNNNNILVSGPITGTYNGKIVLARYLGTTTPGSLDTTFATSGFGQFTIVGFFGIDCSTIVNSIVCDAYDNIYVGGSYGAPLLLQPSLAMDLTLQGAPIISFVPFIKKFVAQGIEAGSTLQPYGTFLLPSEQPEDGGAINKIIFDTTGSTPNSLYGIGQFGAQADAYASLIRFSTNPASFFPIEPTIYGGICTNQIVPPIFTIDPLSNPGGLYSYTYNTMKTAQELANVLELPAIVAQLTKSLQLAGASLSLASSMSSNFNLIIKQVIAQFVSTYPNQLLRNILFLSLSIYSNECLLISNVTNRNYLSLLYSAETLLQGNIATISSFSFYPLNSPYA